MTQYIVLIFTQEKHKLKLFDILQEVIVSNFCEINLDPPTVTITSGKILFLLVSFLFHPGTEQGIQS